MSNDPIASATHAQVQPLVVPPNDDDISGHLHRQVIGVLGATMPFAVAWLHRMRPLETLPPEALTSISAYYYTDAVAVFAGVLSVLAVYLFTYRGYRNPGQYLDRTTTIIAGFAAVGVACFPTRSPLEPPQWWQPWVGHVHIGSAIVLFAAFAVFALFLFPRSPSPLRALSAGKLCRRAIYLTCGLGIVACLIWAALVDDIFWPETIALEFFAVSWLVKGKADQTAIRLAQRGLRVFGGGS